MQEGYRKQSRATEAATGRAIDSKERELGDVDRQTQWKRDGIKG